MTKTDYIIKWDCSKDLSKCNLKYSDFSDTTYQLFINFMSKKKWLDDSAALNLSWNLDINNDKKNNNGALTINKNMLDNLLKDNYVKNIYLLENNDNDETLNQKKIEFLNNNHKSNKIFNELIHSTKNKIRIDLKYKDSDGLLHCTKFNTIIDEMVGGNEINISYPINYNSNNVFIKLENSDIVKFPEKNILYVNSNNTLSDTIDNNKTHSKVKNINNKLYCDKYSKYCSVDLIGNKDTILNNNTVRFNKNKLYFNNNSYSIKELPLYIKNNKVVSNKNDINDFCIKFNNKLKRPYISSFYNNIEKNTKGNINYNDIVLIGGNKIKFLLYNYSTYSIKNKRAYMEDRYKCISGQNCNDDSISIFSVYDGHGGYKVSEYLKKNLHVSVLDKYKNSVSDINTVLKNTFIETDKTIDDLSKKTHFNDGSTCTMCFIKNNTIYTANCGDSRATLCRDDNTVVELSKDHKPNRKCEKDRIYKCGGFVENVYGCHRVNGMLAVSRSFGDAKLKKYVTAAPEIIEHEISSSDKYIVIATDGLWDVMTNKECINLTNKFLHENKKRDSKKYVFNTCKDLVDYAVEKGSTDNITCTIVLLK